MADATSEPDEDTDDTIYPDEQDENADWIGNDKEWDDQDQPEEDSDDD